MSQLENLSKHQNDLRLAAAGALLHNLGKISSKFIRKALRLGNDTYLYQHIPQMIAPHCSSLPAGLWDGCPALADSDILDHKTRLALTSHFFSLDVPFDDRSYTPGDMIEYLGVKEPWYKEKEKSSTSYNIEYIFHNGSRLTHLMNRAHRGASGGEKEGIEVEQQKDGCQLWLSTPFGWETAAASVPHIDNLLQKIEKVIQKYLDSTSESFSLTNFAGELKPLLSKAIADTQRPLNDVTVWDIGHAGMAFLFTQALGLLLKNQPIGHDRLYKKENTNQLFWRVLEVRFDGIRYINEAISISDLRVRKKILHEANNHIQKRLESDLMTGVKIYGDENGAFYLMPDWQENDPNWQAIKNEIAPLLEVDGLKLSASLAPSPLVNHPEDKATGEYVGTYIVKWTAHMPSLSFEPNTLHRAWQDRQGRRESGKEICVSCNIRPQGYGAERIDGYKNNVVYYSRKAEKRRICCVCMDRRSDVSRNWATSGLNRDTIWTYEASDANGRLALITGRCSFEDFVPTMAYPPNEDHRRENDRYAIVVEFWKGEPENGSTFILRNDSFQWDSKIKALVGKSEIRDTFRRQKLNIHEPDKIQVQLKDIIQRQSGDFALIVKGNIGGLIGRHIKCLGHEFGVENENTLLASKKESRDKVLQTIFWGNSTCPFIIRDSRRIAYAAESQSFARTRRVWETAERFWKDVFPTDERDNFKKSLVAEKVGTIGLRLSIKGTLEGRAQGDTPGEYHIYDLILRGNMKLDVVWDPVNTRFITADNLKYLAKPERLGQSVKSWLEDHKREWLILEEPVESGEGNQIWGKIYLEEVFEISDSEFVPAIPTLAEPRTFISLVPADKALDIIDAIKTKYEREMGKVRNRLPLHLGVVYFHRRTPLRAAFDAGRRMLAQKPINGDQLWTVLEDAVAGELPKEKQETLGQGTAHFQKIITVKIEQADRKIHWHVPAVMGDGTTDDNWYPYVFIETDGDDGRLNDRKRVFKGKRPSANGTDECWLLHAAELKKDDKIYFTPATFDFEWLDTSARRFEIAYDDQGKRQGKLTRPYLLDELESLRRAWDLISGENGLSTTQIRALQEAIETRRESWQTLPRDEIFQNFCRDVIRNGAWGKRPFKEDIDALAAWSAGGLLADAIELYMGIMKEKPKRDEREEVDS